MKETIAAIDSLIDADTRTKVRGALGWIRGHRLMPKPPQEIGQWIRELAMNTALYHPRDCRMVERRGYWSYHKYLMNEADRRMLERGELTYIGGFCFELAGMPEMRIFIVDKVDDITPERLRDMWQQGYAPMHQYDYNWLVPDEKNPAGYARMPSSLRTPDN